MPKDTATRDELNRLKILYKKQKVELRRLQKMCMSETTPGVSGGEKEGPKSNQSKADKSFDNGDDNNQERKSEQGTVVDDTEDEEVSVVDVSDNDDDDALLHSAPDMGLGLRKMSSFRKGKQVEL